MKVYVTARFKGAANKQQIEELCHAVRAAGMKDSCFVRDVEHYKHKFDNPKELWERTFDEIGASDALLIDVTDHPTGGRLLETGIAYATHKPIIVIKREGTEYKRFFDGIAEKILTYHDYKDLTRQLKEYDKERNFTITDKGTLLAMFMLVGAVVGWTLSQLFIPLGFIAIIGYWLIIRQFFVSMRAYDRIIIYIPLALVWLYGFFALQPLYLPLALAWAIVFWAVALIVLRKLKFSL